MSKETVQLFFERLDEDGKLQEQITRLSNEHKEAYVQKILALAAEHDYEFTRADLESYEKELLQSFAERGELTEEDLESVAGGFMGFTGRRLTLTNLTNNNPTL